MAATSEGAGLSVEFAADPAEPGPDRPVALSYTVRDAGSGEAITDLPLDHERPMHTILTSADLEDFAHIHPRAQQDGSYRVETTPPRAGTYRLYTEFVQGGEKILDRRRISVGAANNGGARLTPDLSPKTIEGTTVSLDVPGTVQAGEPVHLDFRLTREGEPVTDLAPYLGAAAHVAIVSEDGSAFAHGHGEARNAEEAAHSGEDHRVPGSFGPGVRADHTFGSPGLYKLWAQFESDGRVISAPFVVEVRS
jgi:Cu+-exporting ATPase